MSLTISSVLSLRVTADERALLEAAAAGARANLSEFIRKHAVEAAEAEIMARRHVTIPAADWERFEAWVAQPAETIPALADLARRRPTWDR